jgi:hypothetical protein
MSGRSFIQQLGAFTVCTAAVTFLFNGCTRSEPTAKPQATDAGHDAHEGGEHGHDHHHAEKGPHGGTLVAIGDEAAHVEFVLDAEAGVLTAYVLDAEAKKPVDADQDTLDIGFTVENEETKKDEVPELRDVILKKSATSEAEFSGQSDNLKGLKEFSGSIGQITVNGKEFKNVTFEFPEGNEHEHHHH